MGSFRKRLLVLIIGLVIVTQTVTLAAVLPGTPRTPGAPPIRPPPCPPPATTPSASAPTWRCCSIRTAGCSRLLRRAPPTPPDRLRGCSRRFRAPPHRQA